MTRQFFQTISKPLCPVRPTILDLNCGTGEWLYGAADDETKHLLAATASPDLRLSAKTETDKLTVNRIAAPIGNLMGLCLEVDLRADLIVCSSPGGTWQFPPETLIECANVLSRRGAAWVQEEVKDNAKAGIHPDVTHLLTALTLLSRVGEGVMIGGEGLQRAVFDRNGTFWALNQFIWAKITLGDCEAFNGLPGRFIAYFARSHKDGWLPREPVQSMEELEKQCQLLANSRASLLGGANALRNRTWLEQPDQMDSQDTHKLWQAIKDEFNFRNGKASSQDAYNIWLTPTKELRVGISLFQRKSSKTNQVSVQHLESFGGMRLEQLVQDASKRRDILAIAEGKTAWIPHPELAKAVLEAVNGYQAIRAPLYPLSKIQALGYLDEETSILCVKDLHIHLSRTLKLVFQAGKRYAMHTGLVTLTRMKNEPDMTGKDQEMFRVSREMAVFITDGRDYKRIFAPAECLEAGTKAEGLGQAKPDFTFQVLVEHFDIPIPPDVAKTKEADYQQAIGRLKQMEDCVNGNMIPQRQ